MAKILRIILFILIIFSFISISYAYDDVIYIWQRNWVNYLGREALAKHEQYVDRIGNYTLLGQKLNIKASNNPFRAKKKEYKKSNIRLTQDLVANYSRFKFKQVERRSMDFSKIAVKIWSL